MFIGRTTEMSELNRLYSSGSFEMPVIYGRRRVGKTRLITEFIQGKRAIYFQARRTNAEANLQYFSQAMLARRVRRPYRSDLSTRHLMHLPPCRATAAWSL